MRAMAALFFSLLATTAGAEYRWTSDGRVTDYYRWTQVEPRVFATICGWVAPDAQRAGAACAIRLMDGIVELADKRVADGEVAGYAGPGKLCAIFSTVREDEAYRMRDQHWERDLRGHELEHCRGMVHQRHEP